MPKKTKREKMLADARRILLQAGQAKVTPSVPHAVPYQFSTGAVKTVSAAQPDSDNQEFKEIRSDLVKTIAVSAFALTAEILLFVLLPK